MSALFSTCSHCGLRLIVRPPPPYTARFPGALKEERGFSRAAAAAAAARAGLLSASSAAALAPVTRARVASYKARDDAAAAAAVAALRSATRPAATASFDGASLRFFRAGCAQRDHGEDGHGSLTPRKDVPQRTGPGVDPPPSVDGWVVCGPAGVARPTSETLPVGGREGVPHPMVTGLTVVGGCTAVPRATGTGSAVLRPLVARSVVGLWAAVPRPLVERSASGRGAPAPTTVASWNRGRLAVATPPAATGSAGGHPAAELAPLGGSAADPRAVAAHPTHSTGSPPPPAVLAGSSDDRLAADSTPLAGLLVGRLAAGAVATPAAGSAVGNLAADSPPLAGLLVGGFVVAPAAAAAAGSSGRCLAAESTPLAGSLVGSLALVAAAAHAARSTGHRQAAAPHFLEGREACRQAAARHSDAERSWSTSPSAPRPPGAPRSSASAAAGTATVVVACRHPRISGSWRRPLGALCNPRGAAKASRRRLGGPQKVAAHYTADPATSG